MQRIKALTESDLTPEQKIVWDRIVSGPRGDVALTHNTWLRNPDLSEHIQQLGAYLRYEVLSDKQRELAILVTGRCWDCELEWILHVQQARDAGHGDADLAVLAAGGKPDFDETDLSAIYDYVVEINQTREITDATYEAVLQALGEKGVVELVALVGFYDLTAMLIKTFQFDKPEGVGPIFTH
jgi:4-carboxymuconolactone decarboxylase